MKKIYISPAVNVTRMQMESLVCESIKADSQNILKGDEGGFKKGANDRRSVNEDGLRDWNINLW